MLPLAGDWGLQQELEAAAGGQAQQPHLEGQENVAIYLKFLQRQSTSDPRGSINSPLTGENSTWRQSQATQLRLGSIFSAKETQASETPFPLTQTHPGWAGAGAVGGQEGMSWWKTHSCLLLPPVSLPSATMSNVSCHCVCSLCRKVPDGGREDWRTLLVLPEVSKSTGTTPGSDSSLFRAGPCTTMKWFWCQ